MSNQITYSSNSTVDLWKDQMVESSGSATLSTGIIYLSGTARAVFEYEFNTTSYQLQADSLQFNLEALGNITTRYNNKLYICFYVTYWQEVLTNGTVSGYEEGKTDSFTIYPYVHSEMEEAGNLEGVNSYTLQIRQNLIKKIRIEYCLVTEGDAVQIKNVQLNNSVSVSSAISEAVGFDISLERVDWYTNGFRLTYANSSGEDRFYWNGDEHDNLNGINVNGEKLIYMETHDELLD